MRIHELDVFALREALWVSWIFLNQRPDWKTAKKGRGRFGADSGLLELSVSKSG